MTLDDYSIRYAFLREPAKAVTEAYEKAARYFDQMKEIILIDHGLVHTSNVFHATAHWFPTQFDFVGDILHQRHIMQLYGATPEFPTMGETDMGALFLLAVETLNEIDEKLKAFISVCDENGTQVLARQLENLQIANSKEYEKYMLAWKMYEESESASSFDNWIANAIENGGDG